MNQLKKIEINSKTVWLFFGIIVLLIILWLIRDILAALFVALIITASLSPTVNSLTRYLKYRVLSVAMVYLIILAILVLIVIPIIPTLTSQARDIVQTIPQYTQEFSWFSGLEDQLTHWWEKSGFTIESVYQQASQSINQLFQLTGSVISFFTYVLLVIVISFYGLTSEKRLKSWLRKNLPEKYQKIIRRTGQKIYHKLGNWLRAQIILALIVGILVGGFLSLINVPYALFIGALAGLFELVPVVGPILATIPALIVAFAISPTKGLLVLGWLVIIHLVEGYILVPKIMEKALGIHPILILTALVIGAKLGGIIGVLISIPLAASLVIILQEYNKKHEGVSEK